MGRQNSLLSYPVGLGINPATDLLYLGREYPQGYDFFRARLRKAFSRQRDLEDEDKIRHGIQRAEFVKKGKPYTEGHRGAG